MRCTFQIQRYARYFFSENKIYYVIVLNHEGNIDICYKQSNEKDEKYILVGHLICYQSEMQVKIYEVNKAYIKVRL